MTEYGAPTIQVHVRCGCAKRPRKPPLHLVADTIAAIREALSAVCALDAALPGVAEVQAKICAAFNGSRAFQTWRCPKCQEIVEITIASVHISASASDQATTCTRA